MEPYVVPGCKVPCQVPCQFRGGHSAESDMGPHCSGQVLFGESSNPFILNIKLSSLLIFNFPQYETSCIERDIFLLRKTRGLGISKAFCMLKPHFPSPNPSS